jgi:hypothetical protein
MTYVYGHHSVKDFATWKTYFDGNENGRVAAGMRLVKLFQAADNPNQAHFLFEVDDPKKVEEFMGSEETKELMMEAGVLSEPHIHVLTGV